MNVAVVRYSERPVLWDALSGLAGEVWPEYNMHGDVVSEYGEPNIWLIHPEPRQL